MIRNKNTEYAKRNNISFNKAGYCAWNKIAFLRRFSDITKGLYCAICLTYSGMLSKGRMTDERNKNTLPTDIEASVAVSSDIKIYPLSIPMNVKKVVISNKIGIIVIKAGIIWALKKKIDIPTIITSWSITNSMFVR